MIAIIGAGLCLIVIILSVLLICGLPLGELTMGGQYKVYPGKLRIVLVVQLILWKQILNETRPLFFYENFRLFLC